MKTPRIWILLGATLLLGLWYVSSFTEWLRPEPIQIIAQFRPLPKEIQARRANAGTSGDIVTSRAPRVERREPPVKTAAAPPADGAPLVGGPGPRTETKAINVQNLPVDARTMRRGGLGLGRAAAGRSLRDIQPFVFSLDGRYRLTSLKVVETSSTSAIPPIAWWVRSKSGSSPTDNILYGRAPDSLMPMSTNSRPDKLLPGRTYTLFVEAGRRRGEKSFSVPQEAEPVPPDDGDYHPEKDLR